MHRIDQDKKSNKLIFYLIEIKLEKIFDSEKIKQIISKRLFISKIINDPERFEIAKIFKTKFAKNVDQLKINRSDNIFKTYYSNGNLSAGIHKWLVDSNQLKYFIGK